MAQKVLIYEVKDGIAFLKMNRPKKLNALDGELSDALRDAWIRFEKDPKARVAILSGAGKSFCSGRDLTPGAVDDEVPFQVHQSYPLNGTSLFKPIIAAVQGYAMGSGFALAVKGADITVAAASAKFGFPESRAGIAINPIQYVPFLPFKVSLEFHLTAWKGGSLIDAQRAYQLGLVNSVVPDAQLTKEAIRWAELLKKIPPLYIKSVKFGHYPAVDTSARARERNYLDYVWPQHISDDRKEAQAAFRAKRDPKFKGR